MRNCEGRGRYVVYERGLLRSRATALEGGPSCGSSDDLGEALGMLDVVLEFGLQGFVVFGQVKVSEMVKGAFRFGKRKFSEMVRPTGRAPTPAPPTVRTSYR